VEVLTVSKVRGKYYVEKGIIIALDEVEGLGSFIEIEAMTERHEDVPQLIDKLRAILTELGVERFERRSYLELLLEKEGANGKA
jgi:adenylate cyclase class 2